MICLLRGLYLRAGPEEVFAMAEPQDALFRLERGVATRFDCARREAD